MRSHGGGVRAAVVLFSLIASSIADEAPKVVAGANSWRCIVMYKPTNDMSSSSVIDLDIFAIINETTKRTADGYTAATKIYAEGAYSKMSDGTLRNIKGWTIQTAEPLGKLYNAYGWNPHGLLQAALAGTNDKIYGNFSTGVIAKEVCLHVARMSRFSHSKWLIGARNCLADFLQVQGIGAGNGVAAYVNAESRSEFFQTRSAASTSGNGPKSMVNDFLLKAAQNGRDLIKTAGNGEKLNDIAKCIRAQMKVPLIQGCLLYAYDADVTTAFSADDDADKLPGVENKAEMWAFCSAALPYLAVVDATAAASVRAEADFITDTKMPSFNTIKAAFSAKNLNAMGVRCSDIGTFTNFALCTDGTLSNAEADSSKCVALTKVKECDEVASSSAASFEDRRSFASSLALVLASLLVAVH